jgi:hypothetical protein
MVVILRSKVSKIALHNCILFMLYNFRYFVVPSNDIG